MPRRTRFSVNNFMGMITADDPSIIPESYLQYAENVDFSDAGKVSPVVLRSYLPDAILESQGAAWLPIGDDGEVWNKRDNVVYRDGVAVTGVSENSNRAFFYTDGTDVMILDGEGVYVYRDGTWVNTTYLDDAEVGGRAFDVSYDSLGLVSHSIEAGTDRLIVVLDSDAISTGMGDGSAVQFIHMDASWGGYDLVWSPAFGTHYLLESTGTDDEYYVNDSDNNEITNAAATGAAGGTIYGPFFPHALGIGEGDETPGAWRYYGSFSLELDIGTFETGPVEFTWNGPSSGADNLDAMTIIKLVGDFNITAATAALLTNETDLSKFNFKVYRTAMGESDLYELRSIPLTALPGPGLAEKRFSDYTNDQELGDAFTEAAAQIETPSVTRAAFAQRRMFACGDTENPNTLYMSRINQYGVFDASGTIEAPGRIVNISTAGDKVVLFGENAIWVYALVDEYGQFVDTDSPVGTSHADGMIKTDAGVVFCRDDGVWLFNGNTSVPISREIDKTWALMSGNIQAEGSHNTMVFLSNSKMIMANMRYGILSSFSEAGDVKRPSWSVVDPPQTPDYLVNDPLSGTVYAQVRGEIYNLFSGSESSTMVIKTKDFGGARVWQGWQLLIDMDPEEEIDILVASNRGIEKSYAIEPAGRKLYRVLLPKNLAGEYMNVKVTGAAEVFSIDLEMQ